MPRREFSVAVKEDAYERAGGPGAARCESGTRIIGGEEWPLDGCGLPIVARPNYDHIIPDGLGGEPTLDNCQVLCGPCHTIKTHGIDRPKMNKADMVRKKNANIKPTSRPMAGSRDSNLKHTIGGGVVYRDTGEPVKRGR